PKTTMRAMCSAVLMTPALHAVQKPFAGIAHTRFFHRACTISSKRFFHMPSHVGQQASIIRRFSKPVPHESALVSFSEIPYV
ncbi:hypothetical protein, partial [Pseudomonas viridiflava]|uniref:hypothetical protein n=1 Tax=Pseudomonas viridiflava TaxID=33069 RepID=UPI0019CFCC07